MFYHSAKYLGQIRSAKKAYWSTTVIHSKSDWTSIAYLTCPAVQGAEFHAAGIITEERGWFERPNSCMDAAWSILCPGITWFNISQFRNALTSLYFLISTTTKHKLQVSQIYPQTRTTCTSLCKIQSITHNWKDQKNFCTSVLSFLGLINKG